MTGLVSERLRLRRPVRGDAAFILRLLNDPDWLNYIGDRGVRSEAEARHYITDRLLPTFDQHGFGLWIVEPRDGGPQLGLCGLLKRDTLPDVDLGYAFLAEARGQGYAEEATRCVLKHAAGELGLRRVVAIIRPGNAASERLAEKLGMVAEHTRLAEDGQLVRQFGMQLRV